MAEIVEIAGEANRRSIIENAEWNGAIIVGPAVLAPLENVSFLNSTFDADADSLFIEVPEGRGIVGVIGLKNVTFNDCEFRNVGVAGTPASITKFREGMESTAQEASSGAR